MYGISDEECLSICTKVMVYKISVSLFGVKMLTKSSESLLGRDNILFFAVEFSEGREVKLTANKVNDDGALDGVVVTVIGKLDAGVILRKSGGMKVELTASKVNDDGALGDMVVAVICIHDGS